VTPRGRTLLMLYVCIIYVIYMSYLAIAFLKKNNNFFRSSKICWNSHLVSGQKRFVAFIFGFFCHFCAFLLSVAAIVSKSIGHYLKDPLGSLADTPAAPFFFLNLFVCFLSERFCADHQCTTLLGYFFVSLLVAWLLIWWYNITTSDSLVLVLLLV